MNVRLCGFCVIHHQIEMCTYVHTFIQAFPHSMIITVLCVSIYMCVLCYVRIHCIMHKRYCSQRKLTAESCVIEVGYILLNIVG